MSLSESNQTPEKTACVKEVMIFPFPITLESDKYTIVVEMKYSDRS
jgi:hypothetical protein